MQDISQRSGNKLNLFKPRDKWSRAALAVFVFMHLLMVLNVVVHPFYRGYDGWAFMYYIGELSNGHLPTIQQTPEFFSPPLPFAIPALAMRLLGLDLAQAAKVAQVTQVFVSMGMIGLMVRLCNRVGMRREGTFFTILLLAILPVYYRTFAMVRGEPWVLFFVMLMLDRITLVWFKDQMRWAGAVWIGVALGLGLLSRHWMIFTVPMLFIVAGVAFWKLPARRKQTVRVLVLSLLVGFVISSWFFFHLKFKYGRFTAFSRELAQSFTLDNLPEGYFTDPAWSQLMNRPRRPHLKNKFFPVMYAETFGDYWCYFTVYFQDRKTGEYIALFRIERKKDLDSLPAVMDRYVTNVNTIVPYMAMAMRVSLFPCLLLVCGVVFGIYRIFWARRNPDEDAHVRLLMMVYGVLILTTIAGYGWFIVMCSFDIGDTIKPTYILHVFPFIALCGGWMLQTVWDRWQRVGVGLLVLLLVTWAMLLPMMISHHGVMRDVLRFLETG